MMEGPKDCADVLVRDKTVCVQESSQWGLLDYWIIAS